MEDIFDEDFVKFLLGFTGIILLSLGVIFLAQSGLDGEAETDEAAEVMPMTATTSTGQ